MEREHYIFVAQINEILVNKGHLEYTSDSS